MILDEYSAANKLVKSNNATSGCPWLPGYITERNITRHHMMLHDHLQQSPVQAGQ